VIGAIRRLGGFLDENGLDIGARGIAIDHNAFKYQRRRLRLTQDDVAKLLGVKTQQISHVESNRNGLSLLRLLAALAAFGVPASEILSEKIRPATPDNVRSIREAKAKK